MMSNYGWCRRLGASLPETQLVIILIAVVGAPLAALIWGTRAQDDAYAAYHNLIKIRQLIELYRRDHPGRQPASLSDLTQSTAADGTCSGGSSVSKDFPIAPYLVTLPENPLCEGTTAQAQQAKSIDRYPAKDADVTPSCRGGWLYNPQTGAVWIDHERFYQL